MSKIGRWMGLAKVSFDKHSPEILTGLGVTGLFASVIFSIKATPKAMKSIENKKKELDKEKLTLGETIGATWKHYIPTAVTVATSTACIIGANSVNTRRNAALAAAYSLSETAMAEYKDKVREIVGERKESDVRADIARDRMAVDPPNPSEVIITGKGETWFRESITHRYFKSDIEKVRKVENDLNREMRNENTISVNDMLYALGLPSDHKVLGGVCIELDYRFAPECIV